MKKIFVLPILLVFIYTTSYSQQGSFKMDINYTAGIPVGNLRNLVSHVSGRGWGGAIMYGVSDRASIGLETSLQDFYQKYPRTVIHQPGSDISAVVTNSIQAMPVLIKGKYNLTTEGPVRPFAAIGAGADFISYSKYYGEFSDDNTALRFGGQAELGVEVPFGHSRLSGFHLAAGYNYLPYKYNDANGLSFAGIKAGITFNLQ